MKVTIITVKFYEDDIYEGSLSREVYENAAEYVWHPEDVEEAADILKREGLTFAATGGAWAADPDGSFVADYVTGERHEVSGHLDGFTIEDENRVRELVG